MDGESGFGYKWKVKKILVNPGKRLSLQRHAKRDEFWVVTQGQGTLTDLEGKAVVLTAGVPIFIPAGKVHRVENTSYWPLEIVEIQAGMDCDEKDIERLQDDYGRENTNG